MRDGTINLVRVYQMTTPMGDVVTTYQEADSVEQSFRNQIESQGEVATLLRDHIKNTHGIDIAAGPPPAGEQVLYFSEPASPRQPGIGFSAPLQPGKTDAYREFGRAVSGPRKAEWERFNKGLGVTVHHVFLLPTPMGDFTSVYFEAPDPAAANRGFAADTSEFGTYFKQQVGDALGIDFNEPLPPIKLVFEAQSAKASV